jgi:hypothetical protein
MARTVKTFPLRDQSEVKGKLRQIANSTEMRSALMNPISSEVANNRCNPDYHTQHPGDLPSYYSNPLRGAATAHTTTINL